VIYLRLRLLTFAVALGLAGLGLASPSRAQEAESTEPPAGEADDAGSSQSRSRGFGGPDQVDNTIANDEETVSRIIERKIYEPWFEWKKGLQEKHGLSFSVDYSLAWLGASASPAEAEDQASSGMVRFFGSWDLVGRESGNTGAFVWKVEHRHKYGAIPASALGFNLGYAGLHGGPSDCSKPTDRP
jgi:hypothetical protein